MTIEEKQEQCRVLMGHVSRLCNEYIHEKGLLDKWKITDPAKLDEYHKLLDLLNHHMELFLKDVIPWNNHIVKETEVIQLYPEDTPVTVEVPRYDVQPSVMQTARDILVFAVLP